MSGVTEEVGKTAQTVVEALKSTPAMLALVIFNMLFVVMVGYLSIKGHERADREATRWQEIAAAAIKACSADKGAQLAPGSEEVTSVR